jgi:predicted TPR repeat methyltransferase
LAQDEQKLIGQAFHALSGYGYAEAAIRCGEARLAHSPDDPVPRYLIAALAGAPVKRAPDDYLIRTFDEFAESFDRKLVDVLDYRVPQKMRGALEELGDRFVEVLDAGCGTGLAGPLLNAPGRRLTGVDISPGMLAKARERAVYDRLDVAEIHDFLRDGDEPYDLIFAADVMVYIGDLGPLMECAAARLAPRGVLAFSVEATQAGDYVLRASGRFAHSRNYIDRVSRGLFEIERAIETQIRLDVRGAAEGTILLLRRTSA